MFGQKGILGSCIFSDRLLPATTAPALAMVLGGAQRRSLYGRFVVPTADARIRLENTFWRDAHETARAVARAQCAARKKLPQLQYVARELGGGSGIRTHDTVSRIHAFQACAFSHSATPPFAARS
jgi:hypothetical protein